MDQIKVVFNNQIKRCSLPNNYDFFIINLKKLYEIPEKYSLSYFDPQGKFAFITNNNYEEFKTNVKNSQSTIKVVMKTFTELQHNEESVKEETFIESVFSFIQNNLDNGYYNLKKLYFESKMTEMFENAVNETSKVVYSVHDKLHNTFCFEEKDNQDKHFQDKYFEQLKMIKINYRIKRSDHVILDHLNKNNGDIEKTVTELMH